MTTWIQTRSDRKVDLVNPDPASIVLTDIAATLSVIPRYNGHTRRPYTVGHHCCHIAYALWRDYGDVNLALAGLLHDAPEAYLGDITSPMYEAMGIEAKRKIKALHQGMWYAIAEALDLDTNAVDIHDPRVREYDLRILLDERAVLFGPPPQPWDAAIESAKPLGVTEQIMRGAGPLYTAFDEPWLYVASALRDDDASVTSMLGERK